MQDGDEEAQCLSGTSLGLSQDIVAVERLVDCGRLDFGHVGEVHVARESLDNVSADELSVAQLGESCDGGILMFLRFRLLYGACTGLPQLRGLVQTSGDESCIVRP